MTKAKVYDIFYTQSEIQFSKGYKIFEEVYEELKDKLNLDREEIDQNGWTLVIVRAK